MGAGLRSSVVRHIHLTLLGDCSLTIEGKAVRSVPASFFRVAAYLVLAGKGGAPPRHRLSALLWSDADDGKAATNMRQALARIRHLQDEHNFRFIEADFTTLHLPATRDVRCDLIEFADHMSGERPLSPVQLSRIYGGELLAGLDEGGEGFEEWLTARRDRLLAEAVDGIAAGLAPDNGLSLADRATCARRLLEIDPYNEEALRVLLRDAAERRQIQRLTHLYEAMRSVLAADLGVQPTAETQLLYMQLLRALTV